MLQFTRFLDAKAALEESGVTFPICHCAASAAVLNYPCTHLDMVRPGILLYGYYPAPGMQGLEGGALRPVMTLKSRVTAVRRIPAGTPVSYGRTVCVERDTVLAVLPIGYGDGFSRSFSNQAQVLIRGKRCKVVGRVCMDMCMVAETADLHDLFHAAAPDLPCHRFR